MTKIDADGLWSRDKGGGWCLIEPSAEFEKAREKAAKEMQLNADKMQKRAAALERLIAREMQ